MYKKILFIILFSFALGQHNHNHSLSDDGYIRCATDELEQELQLSNPDFIAKRDAQILKAQQLLQKNPQWRSSNSSQNTIYIPVIFHVLYANAGDNVSAAQIGANFDQINLDFQNLNPDGDEIPSAPNPSNAPYDPGVDYSHQSVRGTHNIVFVGAQGELSGDQLVEGVTIRRYSISQSSVSGVGEASSLASATATDSGAASGYQAGYMNIYIAPLTGGLLGQAYIGFPESVVLDESVGSVESPGTAGGYNRGRTLTHELGHNFTYNHVFAPSSCGQTIWSDVPDQYINNRGANIYEWPTGSGNFYGRSAENSCISSTGKGDQFMNYMDYVYDDQMRMFSEEQALEGYAWAASRNWAQVVNGVTTQIDSDVTQATSESSFTINVTFEEKVTGFTQDDIILENATITNFNGGDGITYSFDIEAIQDGDVKISIAPNSCTGVDSGEYNLPSNEYVVTVDTTPPTTGTLAIGNIQDSQYIIPDLTATTGGNICNQGPNCLNLVLQDFNDELTGVQTYYVSIGLSPTSQEVLSSQAEQSEYFQLDNLNLENYQQYFVNVYAQDLVGLNSQTVSTSFYYFGELLGDFNDDWKVDFDDYSQLIANYPGVDIAPTTGSKPYLFPNFDGVSDQKDLAKFEEMWNWSLGEEKYLPNGNVDPTYEGPMYSNSGTPPTIDILNNILSVNFPNEASTAQLYFEYDIDKYNINYLSSNLNNNMVISANDNQLGIIQVEVAKTDASSVDPIQMSFDFNNNSGSYEYMRMVFKGATNSGAELLAGYKDELTAPKSYNLAQSYPNPFSSVTTIKYDLPQITDLSMVIIDIRGRIVRTLIDNEQRSGFQSIMWDGKNDDGEMVSSGVYFYQIRSSNFNEVGKLVLVK